MNDHSGVVQLTQALKVIYANEEYVVSAGREGKLLKDDLVGNSVIAQFLVEGLNAPVDFDLYQSQFVRI